MLSNRVNLLNEMLMSQLAYSKPVPTFRTEAHCELGKNQISSTITDEQEVSCLLECRLYYLLLCYVPVNLGNFCEVLLDLAGC